MQPAASATYRGVLPALRRIQQQEGIRGLQRGLAAASLLQFTNVATRFGVYNLGQPWLHKGESAADEAQRHMQRLMLGGVSGAAAAVVSNPFFLLKTR